MGPDYTKKSQWLSIFIILLRLFKTALKLTKSQAKDSTKRKQSVKYFKKILLFSDFKFALNMVLILQYCYIAIYMNVGLIEGINLSGTLSRL